MLILFLIVCAAVTTNALADDEVTLQMGDGGEESIGIYEETFYSLPTQQSPDAGEASSGSYGETSIAYSSSIGHEIYSAYPDAPSSASQGAITSPSVIGPALPVAANVPVAQTFQAPQSADQQTLLAYNTLANQPNFVYYNQVMQPWQTFVSSSPASAPMFWVNTRTGWQWYATCPLGGWSQEIMFIPREGTLELYEIYPDVTVRYYNYGHATPGYYYIWFNGDTPGRHMSFVTVNGMPSNSLDVDVVGDYPQQQSSPAGKVSVLVMSKKVKGYDVFVDGVYQTTEGATGTPDGSLTVEVSGNQYHTISISKGDYYNSDSRDYKKGEYYYITL